MLEADLHRVITDFSVPIIDMRGNPRALPIIQERESDSYPKVPIVTAHYSNSPHLEGIRVEGKQKLIEAVGIPNLLLAVPNFSEVRDNPITHPGSKSKYLVEMRLGNDIFMVSTLAPNMLTSVSHYHLEKLPQDMRLSLPDSDIEDTYLTDPTEKLKTENADLPPLDETDILPGIEYYDIVYGLAILHHTNGDKGYPMPKHFAVEPGVTHRMEAGPKGAVFAIRMKNAALYPPELRHIHIEGK
ncbi:MAG TPA: hypothetical protein VHE53_03405 [Patescibacteria group bacterium]|nr:hypothetical protein [Patescibacteria group bacterium]